LLSILGHGSLSIERATEGSRTPLIELVQIVIGKNFFYWQTL